MVYDIDAQKHLEEHNPSGVDVALFGVQQEGLVLDIFREPENIHSELP